MSRPGYPINLSGGESCHYTWQGISGGSVTHVYPTSSYRKQMEDSVGANSAGYPANKPMNGYTGYRFSARVSSASWYGFGYPSVVSQTPHLKGEGTYPTIALIGGDPYAQANNSDLEALLYNIVTSKLQTRIKDQKVNVGVVIAEFKKTCGTVTSAAQRIASAIRSVKRGRMSEASNTLLGGRRQSSPPGRGGRGSRNRSRTPPSTGSAAKDWLALQYGWLPLISDVYGATEELARTMTYRPKANRVSYSAGREDQRPTGFKSTNNFPSVSGAVTRKTSARGFIEYRVSNQTAQLAANTGVMNPLSVAWELVPYSFVVDWFIPVGTYLNNLDYDLGLDFVKGCVSFKSSASIRSRPIAGTYRGNTTASQTWSGGSYEATVEAFKRSTYSTFPSLAVPNFKNPVSLKHAANAIALLRVAFGR